MGPFKLTLTRKGKTFAHLSSDVQARLVNRQYTNATDLLDTARGYARERTGRMKREIRILKTGPLAYTIEAPTPYAVFNEYGTRYMSAQPFMRPAVADVAPRAEQRTVAALREAVR